MLTCMKKGLDLLAEHKGINLDLATIPAEDPRTYGRGEPCRLGLAQAGRWRPERRGHNRYVASAVAAFPDRKPRADVYAATAEATYLL
jgi:hypothetical protein